jgi:hypothetical protein
VAGAHTSVVATKRASTFVGVAAYFEIWLLTSAGWVMGWTIYLIMYGLQGGYTGNIPGVPS